MSRTKETCMIAGGVDRVDRLFGAARTTHLLDHGDRDDRTDFPDLLERREDRAGRDLLVRRVPEGEEDRKVGGTPALTR